MFEYWMNADIGRLPDVNHMTGRHFSQDSLANLIGVVVSDGDEPVQLEGSVSANIIRADGVTITVSGEKDGNRAWVVLPADAYTVIGKIAVILKVTDNAKVTTLGAMETYVQKSM